MQHIRMFAVQHRMEEGTLKPLDHIKRRFLRKSVLVNGGVQLPKGEGSGRGGELLVKNETVGKVALPMFIVVDTLGRGDRTLSTQCSPKIDAILLIRIYAVCHIVHQNLPTNITGDKD